MSEQQNIEYKQSWHDDYLKIIVGFANSQGGTFYIGKNDNGKVVGVADHARLLETLPNKIRDLLGIMPQVNRLEESGLHFIEIVTLPYAVPISLRGNYYIRVGSTTQELKSNALTEFLLRKTGKTWDDVTEPSASLNDIDAGAVERFLKAAKKSGRLPDVEGLSLSELLEKLRLLEEGRIKRAAIVLFGKDPGRFYPNMVVKIGRFRTNDYDLLFQETAEGNLIHLLQDVPEILNKKFFVKPVHFEGLLRIEKGEYPVAALREMLLNALVHRDYMGSTVQIRMYDDRFSIWNEGMLPQGLTLEALKQQHSSRPRNPVLADVCFKGGYIDAWGSGTLKIINSCRDAGLPEPEIKEKDGGIMVTLFKDIYQETLLNVYNLNYRQKLALSVWKEEGEITTGKYQQKFGVTDRTARRDLTELVALGLLEKTGDKKSSKYLFKK